MFKEINKAVFFWYKGLFQYIFPITSSDFFFFFFCHSFFNEFVGLDHDDADHLSFLLFTPLGHSDYYWGFNSLSECVSAPDPRGALYRRCGSLPDRCNTGQLEAIEWKSPLLDETDGLRYFIWKLFLHLLHMVCLSKLYFDPPGDLVWFCVGPQWEETFSVLGESYSNQLCVTACVISGAGWWVIQ